MLHVHVQLLASEKHVQLRVPPEAESGINFGVGCNFLQHILMNYMNLPKE